MANGMARHEMRFISDPPSGRGRPSGTSTPELSEGQLGPVLSVLRSRFDIDFSAYRPSTICRRVARRMMLRSLEDVHEYSRQLGQDHEEQERLLHDLLIGVTEFFRDPDAFQFLYDSEIAAMFDDRGEDEVRIWSAACATGEEAYSLAILMKEAAESNGFKGGITVFATDVHRSSLGTASMGVYDRERLKNVSEERLDRHFHKEGGCYRVNESVRKMVVFAPQDLVTDLPLARIDLVSCRNMLIYLKPKAQDRVITSFHNCLREGGTLFLGSSEALGRPASEFEVMHPTFKVFRRSKDVFDDDVKSSSFGVGPHHVTHPAAGN